MASWGHVLCCVIFASSQEEMFLLSLQEKKECEQKRAKEQGALREQLQVSGPCGALRAAGRRSFSDSSAFV